MVYKKALFHSFSCQSPGLALTAVCSGSAVAGIVRNYISEAECKEQAEMVLQNLDIRDSDVPGGTLGPNLFDHSADCDGYFNDSYFNNDKFKSIESLTRRAFSGVFKSYESMHPDNKIRPVCRYGDPAASARALAFPILGKYVVKAHEDLANVQALESQGFEIAGTSMVIAHNLYLVNPKSSGSLTIWDFRPDKNIRSDIDAEYGSNVSETGYSYPDEVLANYKSITIHVNAGDYVAFRSDYVHSITNQRPDEMTGEMRVSFNGFLSPVLDENNNKDLCFWT